jgi:hypothetical protein
VVLEKMEKISWTYHLRNEEVLLRVKEQRNILHEIHKRKANWIGHVLSKNCLLQRVTKGKTQGGIDVTGRQGRRRRKLLDDLKERRGYTSFERGSSGSHYAESSLWKMLWTCRKTDYQINESSASFALIFGILLAQQLKSETSNHLCSISNTLCQELCYDLWQGKSYLSTGVDLTSLT